MHLILRFFHFTLLVVLLRLVANAGLVPDWAHFWVGNFIFWYLAFNIIAAAIGLGYELGLRAPTDVESIASSVPFVSIGTRLKKLRDAYRWENVFSVSRRRRKRDDDGLTT